MRSLSRKTNLGGADDFIDIRTDRLVGIESIAGDVISRNFHIDEAAVNIYAPLMGWLYFHKQGLILCMFI